MGLLVGHWGGFTGGAAGEDMTEDILVVVRLGGSQSVVGIG